MYEVTAEPYEEPLDYAQVAVETLVMPDGTPAPTGYYPNAGGSLGGAVVQSPMPVELYGYQTSPINTANDWTEQIDQHPYLSMSATWTPPPDMIRPSGVSDPLAAGPPMPDLDEVNLYYTREQGSSNTSEMDVPGHKFPQYGNQDGVSSTYFLDAGLQQAPYNPSMLGPNGEMPDTLRAVPAVPAHGWTEQVVVPTALEAEREKYEDLIQQQPGTQEYLANSSIAGQSYGMRTAYVSNSVENGEVYTVRRRV